MDTNDESKRVEVDAVPGDTGQNAPSPVTVAGDDAQPLGTNANVRSVTATGQLSSSGNVNERSVLLSDKETLLDKSRAITRSPGRNGGTLTPYNSERAKAAAARRYELARQYAAAEVTRRVVGVAEPGDAAIIAAAPIPKQWAAAYGVLVGVQAERAYMDADAQSFRNVRQALGADVGAPERTATATATGTGNDADAADLAQILAAYRAWREAHPDEAARLAGEGE